MEQGTSMLGATTAVGVAAPGCSFVKKRLLIFRFLFQENEFEEK